MAEPLRACGASRAGRGVRHSGALRVRALYAFRMTRRPLLSARLVRLVIALLCWAQLGAVAHAMPAAKSTLLCGHVSLAAIEPLAALAPDEYGKSLRQVLGCDTRCTSHCGAAPGPGTPQGLAVHARPDLGLPAASQSPVALGASRFGRLKPPSTAPPVLS